MELDGYINVLKPAGWTSHDVVGRLRRVTGIRRIGHTGTLDPAAIGVLPVALGHATRTVSSLAWDDKEYLADVRFGAGTDTDDADGEVMATGQTTSLDPLAIQSALPTFVGHIRQRPPAFSAVHVHGVRAYRQARRGVLDLPPERVVQIDAISTVAWRSPVLSVRIQCHSGTYIRSFARDLGAIVGCPAHLAALVRLRVGPFRIDSALDPDRVAAVATSGDWERTVWPTDIACRYLDALVVPPDRASDLMHGRAWSIGPGSPIPTTPDEQHARVYAADGTFLGLVLRRTGAWQPTGGLKPAGGAAA